MSSNSLRAALTGGDGEPDVCVLMLISLIKQYYTRGFNVIIATTSLKLL